MTQREFGFFEVQLDRNVDGEMHKHSKYHQPGKIEVTFIQRDASIHGSLVSVSGKPLLYLIY